MSYLVAIETVGAIYQESNTDKVMTQRERQIAEHEENVFFWKLGLWDAVHTLRRPVSRNVLIRHKGKAVQKQNTLQSVLTQDSDQGAHGVARRPDESGSSWGREAPDENTVKQGTTGAFTSRRPVGTAASTLAFLVALCDFAISSIAAVI